MKTTKKVGVFKRSWQLFKSAWHVVMLDKELLLLPLLGLLATIGVLVIGVAVFIFTLLTVTPQVAGNEVSVNFGLPWLIWLFLFMIAVSVIASFTSGAIIHAALERFNGNDPSVRSSLAAARKKIKSLVMFSLLAATVSLVLGLIGDRVPFLGKIFAWLGGVAWSVASIFTLPYIMTSKEHLGPIEATKKSGSLVKKVWGESLVVSGGIGLITFLALLLYIGITIGIGGLLGRNGNTETMSAVFSITGLGILPIVIISSVLDGILKAAIFHWATTGKAPEAFNKELLRAMLKPKKARKIFSV